MSAPILDVVSLFASQTAKAIFNRSLELCVAVGLPVTSWRIGDPTRTTLETLAQHLESSDSVAAEFSKGAYLDTAEGDWLTLKAEQDYNITRADPVYAAGSMTLANSSAAVYSWDANDLVLKSNVTGKTYRNAAAITLSGIGSTATSTFVAEEAGSASTTPANSLELLTTHLGVTVTSNAAAFGVDGQSDPALRDACRQSLALLSPDGPADAYRYVATNADMTGASTANKATVGPDNPEGLVTVYVSGLQDETTTDDVIKVEDAIRRLVLPLTVDVEVIAATQYDVPVLGTLTVAPGPYSQMSLRDDAEAAVAEFFLNKAIGSTIHPSEIIGAVHSVVPAGLFRSFVLVLPAAPVVLTASQNPRLDGFSVMVVIE